MVSKELSESAVEINAILDKCSEKVLAKIPFKLKELLKKIESKTYKFSYDSNKSLNEQKLKPKTRRLLALIYADYLCTVNEKEEYLRQLNDFFEEEKRIKYEKYNPDNMFKRERKEIKEISNNILVENKKEGFFKMLIRNIKKMLFRN